MRAERQASSIASVPPVCTRPYSKGTWNEAATDGGPARWMAIEAPAASRVSAADTDGRRAPATQHDAWIWISGSAPDVTFDHARAVMAAVDDVATLATEQPGFTYHQGRDETGFIDGTANPPIRPMTGMSSPLRWTR